MSEEEEFSPWFGRCVRFICGAIFGGLVGLRWIGTELHSSVWLPILAGALICGLLAMFLRDTFWECLSTLFWW